MEGEKGAAYTMSSSSPAWGGERDERGERRRARGRGGAGLDGDGKTQGPSSPPLVSSTPSTHQVHKHLGRFLAVRRLRHVQLDPVGLGGGQFDALCAGFVCVREREGVGEW